MEFIISLHLLISFKHSTLKDDLSDTTKNVKIKRGSPPICIDWLGQLGDEQYSEGIHSVFDPAPERQRILNTLFLMSFQQISWHFNWIKLLH